MSTYSFESRFLFSFVDFVRISWTFYGYFADFTGDFAEFWLGVCAVRRLPYFVHENLSNLTKENGLLGKK